MALDAVASSKPMASSTRLAFFTLPDEQAEPALTAKPARSICITCVSPAQPGTAKHEVLGRRGAPLPIKMRSGAADSRRSSSASRSCETRPQTPSSRSRRAASAAAPKPAMPTTFSVPERRPPSWPPPFNGAGTSNFPRQISAPAPFGPPTLWPDRAANGATVSAKLTGSFPAA